MPSDLLFLYVMDYLDMTFITRSIDERHSCGWAEHIRRQVLTQGIPEGQVEVVEDEEQRVPRQIEQQLDAIQGQGQLLRLKAAMCPHHPCCCAHQDVQCSPYRACTQSSKCVHVQTCASRLK